MAKPPPKLNITFDVDLTDYLSESIQTDELEYTFEPILKILASCQTASTWFIRIDRQIETIYGAADYIFNWHQSKIDRLKREGHTLGWHFHSYRKNLNGAWKQNVDEDSILDEMQRYIPLVKSLGLEKCRMGWGYHTNRTMHLLDATGFYEDSSAIPRPNYPWSQSQSDWSVTPNAPYHPSQADYRIPATAESNALRILEVPFTTLPIRAPYDERSEQVIRYLNPAYRHAVLKPALAQTDLTRVPVITTITHPYELIPRSTSHSLLSFSLEDFKENLMYLTERVRHDSVCSHM